MGHYWREMDPEGAAAHDKEMRRKARLKEAFADKSLSDFTVGELEALLRLLGLHEYDPTEEHLALLEAKLEVQKTKRTSRNRRGRE
jgi:hypothetical protein